MLLLKFEVRPVPNSDAARLYKGAFINAWVNDNQAERAFSAVALMLEPEWRPSSEPSCEVVSRNELSGDAVEYFDQAFIDQQVISMHTYRLEAVLEE